MWKPMKKTNIFTQIYVSYSIRIWKLLKEKLSDYLSD